MSGRDNQPPAPYPAANSGEFLLSLLQKPDNRESAAPPSQPPLQLPRPPQFQQQVSTVLDPAIAAVGPSLTFQPSLWQSNGQDVIPPQHWPVNSVNPQLGPNGFLGFPHSFFHSSGNQFQVNQIPNEDSRRLGFSGGGNSIQSLVQHKQQLEHKLKFGSFPGEIRIPDGLPKAEISDLNNGLDRNRQSSSNSNVFHHGNSDFGEQERRTGGGLGKHYLKTTTPPGFPSKLNLNGGENWDPANRMKGLNHNVDRDMISSRELMRNKDVSAEYAGIRGDGSHGFGLSAQLDRPGPPSGSSLRSILASDIEDSRTNLEKNAEVGDGDRGRKEMDEISKQLVDSLLIEDESDDKSQTKQHHKELRSDSRGHHLLSQKMRNELRRYPFRSDIDRLNAPFLSIVESLIPVKEEKAKQKQLLSLLENLVSKEWPKARLYLYGSCANSFGVSKSDIDLCLAIEETDINKAEILLKLADILQSDNLQNVQALTRARVPIVKLMDPVTEISCDICINNVLAVVNTRLLRDYGRIDVRLRQLTFIVKHWAKSRGVNATYQGTLSSYAYVLMCIHFLQNRTPAILPCLQAMDATYYVTVDNVECAYFDQIEKLYGFGSRNKQTISQLVWGFFNYWAYCHDYTDSVISVRTGRILSKRAKDWTRRVGNDRHLICIEDPFETSHDLGRVVDKNSIKVLREEFERAAYIIQNDPNPCVKLFEPYIPC